MVLVPWQLRAWFWQVLLLLHCNNIVVIFFCLALFFQVFELCVADNEKASTLRWRTQKTYRTITKKFCCFENFCSSLTRRQTDCQQNQQGMSLTIVFYVSFIQFFIFGHFWRLSYENKKYYVISVCILQGKMGKTEKKQKENHTTKLTKRWKYGMNEKH